MTGGPPPGQEPVGQLRVPGGTPLAAPGVPPAGQASPTLAPAALVLVMIAGLALFLAGLSLGARSPGESVEERAALEAFIQTYERITGEFVGTVEPRELIEGAIEGMFERLGDPYSSYMSADEFDADLAGITGEFEGIGARMTIEDASGEACQLLDEACQLRVVDVLLESPAQAAGLRADDIVLAIDASPVEGLTMADAITLIRGPRGSVVGLTLRRDGAAIEMTIERQLIQTQDVHSEVLGDGQVGYLRVDGFSGNAADDFRELLGEHLDAGIDRIIVDVRDDPGGFVDAAVSMASQFVASGPVFWEEDDEGAQRPVGATGGGLAIDPSIRVAVLVDAGTASASEILAGALQDTGRATLVGEATFGKGTIQEWTQLPGDNGGFRLSIAKWLTPSKSWVDGVGIAPDLAVESDVPRSQPGRDAPAEPLDAQLVAAMELLLADEPVGLQG